LIGWRVWCVTRRRDNFRLASVIRDQVWPADGETIARCESGHAAPDEHCACGIHAAREPAAILSYLRGRDEPATVARVLGRVQLWGRVIEHEAGWRAERARALEVWLPPELDGALADYGLVEISARSARISSS
jgi:hypothetical protein